MGQPNDNQVMAAITYAIRKEPVIVVCNDEFGDFDVEADDPESLKPFILTVLRELGFIE